MAFKYCRQKISEKNQMSDANTQKAASHCDEATLLSINVCIFNHKNLSMVQPFHGELKLNLAVPAFQTANTEEFWCKHVVY